MEAKDFERNIDHEYLAKQFEIPVSGFFQIIKYVQSTTDVYKTEKFVIYFSNLQSGDKYYFRFAHKEFPFEGLS